MARLRYSALDSTVMFLGEAIVGGHHLPGERLTESQVVDRYDVSRSTARAALQVLSGRGLVERVPGQGARITELQGEDPAALYRLRTMVEPLLIARFTARATPRQVDALDRAITEFGESACASDNLRRIHRGRDAFYEVLFDGADSVSIENVVRIEYARLAVYRCTRLSPERELQRIRATAHVVQGIVPRVSQRDVDAASRFTARTLAEDGSATLRMLAASA